MPKWGLNRDLANEQPWGLEPSLLQPDKTNTDPIHGEIYLNRLERLIVDSPAFQRLRRVRQLGTTHLVYPGAVHTRYQHSLGALRVVQDLFDHVLDNPISEKSGDDLIAEWRTESRDTARRRTAEALVLARLGALLHDFCHIPYGHTIEDDFDLLTPHDKNEERFVFFWDSVPDEAKGAVSGELLKELKAIILSKLPGPTPKYPFVHDLVGNTICADLIDYLWRDYFFTGLPGKLGTRFFSYFFVTRSDASDFPAQMALRIEKNGRLRLDVITEVLKYLRYRYELGERALQHHAKVAADTMIAKALSLWIDARGKNEVENALRTYGDDGVLERLAESEIEGAVELAIAVRDRKLFKEIRHSRGEDTYVRREKLFKTWGSPTRRREVEERAAKAVELPHPWYVLLSIPNPEMRLKAADVLVSSGEVVTHLRAWDELHGRRAGEIYSSHERLWSVQLFVHPAVSLVDRGRIAAYVQDSLSVKWDPAAASQHVSAVDDLAVNEVIREHGLGDDMREQLRMAVHRDAGSEEDETFADVKARFARLVDKASSGKEEPSRAGARRGRPRRDEGGGSSQQGSLV